MLRILSPPLAFSSDQDLAIQRLSLLGLAHALQHRFAQANIELQEGSKLCPAENFAACSALLRAKGRLLLELGQSEDAYEFYLQSLAISRKFNRPMDEASSLMNLGHVRLLEEKYDEAIDWLLAARRAATGVNADDLLLTTTGNLGWAYYGLGDAEKALGMFDEAEQQAVTLRDTGEAIVWLTDSGRVYQDQGSLDSAAQSYLKALNLANQLDSKEDVINALEDLAHVSIQAGKFNDASGYIDQVTPMLSANGNRLDALDILLAQGEIAAARRDDAKAEESFRTVERDPASQTSMRLGAEHQLALLYETEGHAAAAANMYRTALTTFEDARDQLKNEDSKLPFLANATSIYDDYIHFLVSQGKTNEALLTADQSRARTLAQGLGQTANQRTFHPASFSPQAVASKAGATLLFYWLGEKQSYLWAITPKKTALFTLPSKGEITPLVERYSKTLLGLQDPLEADDRTGGQLYTTLVAPAAKLIRPDAPVMILSDGALSQLNFETLIVPAQPQSQPPSQLPGHLPAEATHYWIEDATLMSAPSLAMLAAAKPAPGSTSGGKLLLLGDAVSPSEDYPELPFASVEVQEIQKHFKTQDEVVFTREKATPSAYLESNPRQFSYIHFASHGIASQTDPLDSAIILSRPGPGTGSAGGSGFEDSFKLYAREVMQHPIDARVVTIAACNGSGTRAYAGEGLVGLSWAFLRAGAHSTVGGLWEVSDDSTPRLMNAFYQGLQDGQTPAAALRQAKLGLLHSRERFRKPFYWATFQMYTRM